MLRYCIIPSASEDKCVLGTQLDESVTEHQTNAINRLFEENIKLRYVKELKKQLKNPQYLLKKRKNRICLTI